MYEKNFDEHPLSFDDSQITWQSLLCLPQQIDLQRLLKVHQDITKSLINKYMVTVILLDLSAGFDVIKDRIFQNHLEYSFEDTGSALPCVPCYLRAQSVSQALDLEQHEYRVLVNPNTAFHQTVHQHLSANKNPYTWAGSCAKYVCQMFVYHC